MPNYADFFADTTPDEQSLLELHGLRSALFGGFLFCGVSHEEYAINGVTYAWPRGTKMSWGLTFSRLGSLSDMDCKDVFSAALKEISDCCDFSHNYVSNANAANLKITTQRLDGNFGVLADCQIPVGNVNPETQLLMRLDDGESWVISSAPADSQIDLYRVFLHEAEHAHGLGHKPASVTAPALIAPIYSRTIRSLQSATDMAELVRRYGGPTAPSPTQPPPPTAKPVHVTVEQAGKIWSGPLPRTT